MTTTRSGGKGEDSNPMDTGNRRSQRLANKPRASLLEYSDTESSDDSISPAPARKKRKVVRKRALPPPPADDSDFIETDPTSSSDNEETENSSPDKLIPPKTRRRVAANKALEAIKSSALDQQPEESLDSKANRRVPTIDISPEIMIAARNFAFHVPIFLKPPTLSPNRLRVDQHSIWLYAEEGAKDLWASALSSTRFGGPRRSPPFRELYRLTEPDPKDDSDWAENIRWAKEQRRLFGSVTWSEYEDHLERITQHRRDTMWVSEELSGVRR